MQFTLEKNGPIVAQRMRDAAKPYAGLFCAVACAYSGENRVYAHSTGLAAYRSLASICDSTRGKLSRRGEFAAAIVTPCGRVMTYVEARTAFRRA